jgi:hypothetical protein
MPYPVSRMLRSLRRLLWWLQEKVVWPVADAFTGERGGPAVAEAPREEAGRTRPSESAGWLAAAPLVGLAMAVVASGTLLLAYQSHLGFYIDDWDVLIGRRGSSVGTFLDPHYHHIALAPIAIYKGLLELFGMTSALPFQIFSTLLFLLSVVLLFIYVRRRVGDWVALLASVLILFMGAAWTDLLFSFNITFFGSMAAGIGSLLALDRDDRKGDLIACGLLVVATSFSELGAPFMVAALVCVALGPSPWLRRLYVPLVPAVLYGLWYLGWGHTAGSLATFHNLVHSPRFVFDAISQNLASLFGLATPLNGETGPTVGGLTWGRILLVIAIALAIWRLWKVGRPTRWLWVVLALGLSYWFLTALNADPLRRTPTTGRYQYQGAIFVILIAAEFLRGVRLRRWFLAPAAILTAAVVVSGVIFLHDGYQRREFSSDRDRATLAAVDIGRGHISDDFSIQLTTSTAPFTAGDYYSAVDAFGSPAFSESELLTENEPNRAAADQLLASAQDVRLKPVSAADRHIQAAGQCHTLRGSESGSPAATLGPGNYTLTAQRATAGTGQVGVPVEAARFADHSSVNLGFVNPKTGSALTIPADNSSRPWRLAVPASSAITLCGLPTPAPAPPPTAAAAPDLARINLQLSDLPEGWRLVSPPQTPPATRMLECMGVAGRASASAVAATGPGNVNAISELDWWGGPAGPRSAAAALRQPAGTECLRSAIEDTFAAVGLPLAVTVSPTQAPTVAGRAAAAYSVVAHAPNGGPTAAAGTALYFARGGISAFLLTVKSGGQSPPETLPAELAGPLNKRMRQASRPQGGAK